MRRRSPSRCATARAAVGARPGRSANAVSDRSVGSRRACSWRSAARCWAWSRRSRAAAGTGRRSGGRRPAPRRDNRGGGLVGREVCAGFVVVVDGTSSPLCSSGKRWRGDSAKIIIDLSTRPLEPERREDFHPTVHAAAWWGKQESRTRRKEATATATATPRILLAGGDNEARRPRREVIPARTTRRRWSTQCNTRRDTQRRRL